MAKKRAKVTLEKRARKLQEQYPHLSWRRAQQLAKDNRGQMEFQFWGLWFTLAASMAWMAFELLRLP